MTRRDLVCIGASALLVPQQTLAAKTRPVSSNAGGRDGPETWTHTTPHLDWQHPRIAKLVRGIATQYGQPNQLAVAAFNLVRDTVKFGFATGFWDQKASDVLANGKGYCNTKSTLFVAILRGLKIPARQVFVDIDARVLAGFLDPGTPFVDHSYAEVWLDDAWRGTDAYIVDTSLFVASQQRLKRQGTLLGYGVHATGVATWDGSNPTFSQYNINDPRPLGTKVWGAFDDVADFYRRAEHTWNRLNPVLRAGIGVIASAANQRIEAVRAQSYRSSATAD